MRGFKKEVKSIQFLSHKHNETMAVADRCTVLRMGKYMGTVDIKDTTKEELSRRMVGRDVQLQVEKQPAHPGETRGASHNESGARQTAAHRSLMRSRTRSRAHQC